jgi:eukaryotic-like serine/threonine-protein kinase
VVGALNLTSEQLLNALLAVGILTDDDVRDCHKELAAASGSMTDATPAATRLVKSGKLTKFQANQALGGKAKALVMGDYLILDKIGAGGMGQVFKAQHRRMKRIVALKLLPPSMLKNANSIKRFQREVEAAAKLMHTNIVTAFDAGQSHYLVMEYVEGRDLSAIVKDRGPLPIDEAIHYIRQAASWCAKRIASRSETASGS